MKIAIKILYCLLIIVTIVMTIRAALLLDINNTQSYMLDALVAANISLGFLIIAYSIKHNFKNTITLLLYTLAFMCFNLGTYAFGSEDRHLGYGRHYFQGLNYIQYKNEAYGIILIYLTMLTYFISYMVCNKKRAKQKDKSDIIAWAERLKNNLAIGWDINKVRRLSRYFVFFCVIPVFIKLYLVISYSARYGYVALYLSDSYKNPLLDILGNFYFFGVCAYLATFPPDKKSRIVLITFILYALISVMAGERTTLVNYALMIIWYFCKKDQLKIDKKPVISKPVLILMGVGGFFGAGFLYQYGHYRSLTGFSYNVVSLFDDFISFFSTQGGSGKLIALSIEKMDDIKSVAPGIKTFFSPLISYWYGGGIGRLLGFAVPNQTMAHLYTIGNLGSVLTYFTSVTAYLSGSATGSNYIAEIYVSFGAPGVIVYNIILGFLINKTDSPVQKKWRHSVIYMYLVVSFVRLPRASAIGFIPGMSMMMIFFVLFSLLANRIKERK